MWNIYCKYINNKKVIPEEEYRYLVKTNLDNDIKIFESENAIKEAVKVGVKSIGMNSAILLAARTVASFVLPGYKIESIKWS